MLDALRGQKRSPGCQDVGLIERARTDWLFSIENRRSGTVARNGLGWAGVGLGLTELSNQRAPIFRIRRPRPRSCWGCVSTLGVQATVPGHGTRPVGRGESFLTGPISLPCVVGSPPTSRAPCVVLSPGGAKARPEIELGRTSPSGVAPCPSVPRPS